MKNFNEQFGENDRAHEQYERSKSQGFHLTDLFDQNEDAFGNKADEATGKPYVNDDDRILKIGALVELHKGKYDPKKKAVLDAAEEWLQKNDPKYLLLKKDWN